MATADNKPLTQARPRWLIYLEGELLADDHTDNVQRDFLKIIRVMLEDLGDDTTATSKAAQELSKYYQNSYLTTMPGITEPGLMAFLNDFMNFILDFIGKVRFPSSEHERLSRLLVGIKELGSGAFSTEVKLSFRLRLGLPVSATKDFLLSNAKDHIFQAAYEEALGIAVEESWNISQGKMHKQI
jgi:hypothetical protein